MASTNHTTNYNLSQYVGSDKPTYLQDYNGDMAKIDAQMKVNADNVATAISSAETATSTANSAVSTANQAQSTASSASSTATQANTTANNAQSTANSALSTATSAQTTANNAVPKSALTFTHFDDITLTPSNGSIQDNNVKIATNEDGTIGKIYGRVRINNRTGSVTLTGSTRFRPTSNITVNAVGISLFGTSFNNQLASGVVDMTISTNGNITLNCNYGALETEAMYLFGTVLFMTDFGDTPTPNN